MTTRSLIIDLESTSLSEEERQLIRHPCVAGILLFSRNFTSREQLCELVCEIRKECPELLLLVDQEGGRVQRFKQDFTLLPPLAVYGRYFETRPEEALRFTKDCGWLMASELLCCGVDLSLAPVLDLDLGLTNVVGDRSFSPDPSVVIELSAAWIQGVREAGMSAVIKHFPGHGSVDNDSHLSLPEDSRSFAAISERDLQPFKAHIQTGVQGVIPAHIVFSSVDDQPTGFSRVWLQDILRGQLGFTGIIITDCLTMEGAASAGSYTSRVENATDAGCQLLILSNREGVKEVLPVLEQRTPPAIDQPVADFSQLKPSRTMHWKELQCMERYLDCRDRLAERLKA